MSNENKNMIIIGGGIGGLATALGAAQNGNDVKVLEKAPEIKEIGAGIQLAANGTNVLQKLGVMDKINEVAVFPKRLVLMNAFTGEELSALDIDSTYRERYGAPYIVLHRSDLHRILLEACEEHPKVELSTNQYIKNIETKSNGDVKVTAKNGDSHEANAVIGADGLWSTTRGYLIDDEPICSGYVAYRGAIPMEEVTNIGNLDDVYMWIGPDMHVVQYPVRKGELYNQVVVFKSKNYQPGNELADDWGTPEEMDEVFSGTCDKVQTAVSYISRQKRWPMFDRKPIDKWSEGNFTLIGDAAHPMLQYLAQGACQALEDASFMADMLEKHETNYEKAFTEFEEERKPRTTFVQENARVGGEIIHGKNKVNNLLRNAILKARTEHDYQYVDQYHGGHFQSEEVSH